MTTSDDELQRRLSDLREILVPQVQGVDLDATRRRGRTRRTRRVAAVGVVAALLAVAAVAGARLPALTQRGVVSLAAPGVPSAAPPNAQPPPSSTAKQPPRPLVLTDRGLIGLATFGDPMAQVVRTLQEQLGPPDEEFVNQGNPEGNIFGICPGINGQYLRWGRLWLLFTEGKSDYGNGRWHLFAYYAKQTAPPGGRPEPATERGVHVGSTVADLRAAYGRHVKIFPIEAPAGIGFRIGPPAGPAIDGLLTSSIAAGRVTELHGGQACANDRRRRDGRRHGGALAVGGDDRAGRNGHGRGLHHRSRPANLRGATGRDQPTRPEQTLPTDLLCPGGRLHRTGRLEAGAASAHTAGEAAGKGIPGHPVPISHRIPNPHPLLLRRRRQRRVPNQGPGTSTGRAAPRRRLRQRRGLRDLVAEVALRAVQPAQWTHAGSNEARTARDPGGAVLRLVGSRVLANRRADSDPVSGLSIPWHAKTPSLCPPGPPPRKNTVG